MKTALRSRLNYIRNVVTSREKLEFTSRNYAERKVTINSRQDYFPERTGREARNARWERGRNRRWKMADRAFCTNATRYNFPPRWKSRRFCRFDDFEFFIVIEETIQDSILMTVASSIWSVFIILSIVSWVTIFR